MLVKRMKKCSAEAAPPCKKRQYSSSSAKKHSKKTSSAKKHSKISSSAKKHTKISSSANKVGKSLSSAKKHTKISSSANKVGKSFSSANKVGKGLSSANKVGKKKRWAKGALGGYADSLGLPQLVTSKSKGQTSLKPKKNEAKQLCKPKRPVAESKPKCRPANSKATKPKAQCKSSRISRSRGISKKRPTKKKHSEVYVLELQEGYVYVGKTSRGVATRLREHMSGSALKRAAAFTRLHKPTGRLLPRLGNLEGDGDGPERDETLRQMYRRGMQMVRGWKYVRPGLLRREDLEDIESNIRELFDLCRRCGKRGHFTLQCKEAKDRNGKALRASFLSRR